MFSRKPHKPHSRIDTLIGAGASVHGDLVFSGGLRIDGEVTGNISAVADQPSTLVLSEQARVVGEIRVSHLVVNGVVIGPVMASEYVELQPKARVTGDVHYKAVEMHLGAVVDGRLIHLDVVPLSLPAPAIVD